MLASIFQNSPDQAVKQVAAIILRNSIQTFYSQIEEKFSSELTLVEKVLFSMLDRPMAKKEYEEHKLMIAKIC